MLFFFPLFFTPWKAPISSTRVGTSFVGVITLMFVPAFADVTLVCPAAPSVLAAAPSALANGASLSSQSLSGGAAYIVTLDDGSNMYNDSAAPNNCVGVCDKAPFSGSPWTVPAPSHWYAAPCSGAEGMTPAKALVAAPIFSVELEQQEQPAVLFGPLPKPMEEEEKAIGPMLKPAVLSLGLCSVHTQGKACDSVFAALEQVFKPEAPEEKHATAANSVRPTPGHAVMCGNAIVLSAATSLWSWGTTTLKGENKSADDLVHDFKESASSNAEAVTPIGGHWLRHHVLKAAPGAHA